MQTPLILTALVVSFSAAVAAPRPGSTDLASRIERKAEPAPDMAEVLKTVERQLSEFTRTHDPRAFREALHMANRLPLVMKGPEAKATRSRKLKLLLSVLERGVKSLDPAFDPNAPPGMNPPPPRLPISVTEP